MAVNNSSATGTVDTRAITQGMPDRVIHYGDAIYLVTLNDADSYVHIYKWSDSEIEHFTSQGSMPPVAANTSQSMLTCTRTGSTLHIGLLTVVDSVKTLAYRAFSLLTDTFTGSQETVSFAGSATLASDCLQICTGPSNGIHFVLSLRNAGATAYDLFYSARSEDGVWTNETITTGLAATAYIPAIDVDTGGLVMVLINDGTSTLTDTSQWTGWERSSAGAWTSTAIEGMGHATLVHTRGNTRHAMFFGDKRHTKIAGKLAGRESTIGAIQFEQPDIDGGIIAGTNYGYGFSAVADGNDIHLMTSASGRVYQGGYISNVWRPLRVVSALAASRTTKAATVVSASISSNVFAAACKLDDGGGKGWHVFEVGKATPPRAGITHDIVIDNKGFMTTGLLSKADVSQSVPRLSLATELKTEDNISDLSSVTQYTFHNGRGELFFENPFAFSNVKKLLTHIPNQVTPQLYPQATSKTGGASPGSFDVGPGGQSIGPGSVGIGPNVVDSSGFNLSGYPVDDVVYAGNYWILVRGDAAANNALYYWHNTNGLWTAETAGLDTTSGIPQDLEIFNEDLWVAQGDADLARVYNFSGTAWVDATVPAYCFKTFDDKLWRADNINKIYYSEDADDVGAETWIELGRVDDGSGTTSRIRRMEVYNSTLLIFADLGVWQVIINATGNYQLLPLLNDEAQRNSRNGSAAANYGGLLFYNTGNGITRFDGASRQEMGPNRNPVGGEKFHPMPEEMRGDFSYMRATDTFLYLAIDAGTTGTSSVWVYNGTGWNEFWEADDAGDRCRWVSHTPRFTTTGVLSKRNLWVESGGIIYRIQLPAISENPLEDDSLSYRAGGEYMLMTGWQHHNMIAVDKVMHELIARFKGFSTEAFEPNLHVYFQTEGGDTTFDLDDWTYLTTFSRNPGEVSNILNRMKWSANPDEYQGAVGGLIYKQVRFLVVFDMDIGGATSTTTPPVLNAFGQRFVLRTDRRFGITTTVQAYDEIITLEKEKLTDQHDEVRHELYGFADQKTVHFLDDGTMPPVINWILNPGFELDSNEDGLADQWTKVNSSAVTTSQSAKHKNHGRYSQKIVVSAASVSSGIEQDGLYLPPGVQGHVVISLFVESGIGALVQVVNAANGEVLGRSQVVFPVLAVRPPATFYDAHVDVDAQDTLVELAVQVIVSAELADNVTTTTMYADSAQLYLGKYSPHYYVDGDQPRCQWIDTTVQPYLSPSYRRGTYAVYINGLSEVVRKIIPTTGGRAIKESDITVTMREAGV